MIDWKAFSANGGYHGECDPQCYDDGQECNAEDYEPEYEPDDSAED